MSHNFQKSQWSTAVDKLKFMQEEENNIEAITENQDKINDHLYNQSWFEKYANLFIKYVTIYKNLEECYDQIVHPQKRETLMFALETVMSRLVEIQKSCTKQFTDYLTNHKLNHQKGTKKKETEFLIFNTIMNANGKTPIDLEIPPPKQFRDNKQIESRNKRLDDCLIKQFGNCDQDEDVDFNPYEPPTLDNEDLHMRIAAIKIIQKNEVGRQGRHRQIQSQLNNEIKKKKEKQVDDTYHLIILQRAFRAMQAREKVEIMREEELEFLGMKWFKNSEDVKAEKTRVENRQMRKIVQSQYEKDLEDQRERLEKELRESEIKDLENQEYDKIFEMALYYKQNNGSQNSPDIAKFNDNDAEDFAEKKDNKETKEKKSKKKNKKGRDGNVEQVGPGKSKDDFKLCIAEHEKWSVVEEVNQHGKHYNPEQKGNIDMLKANILLEIQNETQYKVHKQILDELTQQGSNVRQNRKGNRSKVNQRRRGRNNNELDDEMDENAKLENEARRIDRMFIRGKMGNEPVTRNENFEEMVKLRFIRKIKPLTLDQIVGGFDYIASENILSTLDGEQGTYEPSMHQIKNFVVCNLIIPLTCLVVRNRMSTLGKKEITKSVLFQGPQGTGKYSMAKSIAQHSGAFFIDFSPQIDEVYQNISGQKKNEFNKIIFKVFKAARDFGPSIVYIDNVDHQLLKKAKSQISGIKGELKRTFSKLTDKMQIVVIGCINLAASKITTKDLDLFLKKIFFPLPQFTDLKLIWKNQLENQSIKYNSDFRLDSLADISYGQTGGSIKHAVNHVLTKRRIQLIKKIPLKISEFIDSLSQTKQCDENLYGDIRCMIEGNNKSKLYKGPKGRGNRKQIKK